LLGGRTTHAVISDLDIWRAAQLMVKRYGEEAPIQAAMRAAAASRSTLTAATRRTEPAAA